LAFDTTLVGRVIACTYDDPYWSNDGGLTWINTHRGGCRNFLQITVGPPGSSVAYMTTQEAYHDPSACNDFLKSTDGGEFWYATTRLPVDPSARIYQIAIDPTSPREVYAPTDAGIYKSSDGTDSWSPLAPNEIAYVVTIDPSTPTTLYASTGSGIDKSTDSGQTWQQTPLHGLFARSIAIDPQSPSVVYAVVSEMMGPEWQDHVYRSMDGGQDWDLMDQGLPVGCNCLDFGVLAIDSSGRFLHLNTGEGVFDFEIVQPRPVAIPPPVVITGRP
jgi:hypothetical protein